MEHYIIISYVEQYLKRVDNLSLSFCSGQYESNRGEEGTIASTIGIEEEGDAGIALQG